MAKSYTALRDQQQKIRRTYERISPPQPDDQFETLRASVLKEFDRVEKYLQGRVTGDGSMETSEID